MVSGVPSLPWTMRWAVGLLFVEAAALGGLAAFLGYKDLTATNLRGALAFTIFVLLVAVVLALLGVNLVRRHRLARGPTIAFQLLLLPTGYYMITGGLAWLGLPVIAVALGIAGLLIAPASRDALGIR